jgi:radical SAM superfamily enzyme YgiQ (UPF0313 family)
MSEHVDITIRPGEHLLSVGIGRKDVLTYDRTGRPITIFLGGRTYKRGLDNNVLMIMGERSEGGKVRRRRTLGPNEKAALFRRAREIMTTVRERLETGDTTVIVPGLEERQAVERVEQWLALVTSMGPEDLAGDRDRFLSTYRPIGILPPDQYLSVVLQGTEGCSYNRCTFCRFYRGIEFRIKSPDEFRDHIRSVKDLLGPAIGLRKTIFLADANAMVIPRDRLIPMMEVINEEFQIGTDAGRERGGPPRSTCRGSFRGIYSFIDSFSGPMKEAGEFAELRDLSIMRLYLGLESGHDPLLRFLDKPGMAADAMKLVGRIKEAGIGVGVIVMAGIGGDRYEQAHVWDTIELVSKMDMGRGDILYVSDFVVHPESEYRRRADLEGIHPLGRGEILAQRTAITRSLKDDARRRGYKIAPYQIEDFIY